MTKKYLSENEELMKEWDFEANKDLCPNLLTIGSNKKVSWICSQCGYKWITSIYHRASNGHNCPNCHHGCWLKNKKSLAETHPEIAVNWHPLKNNNLTPNMFTKGSRRRIWWQCSKCENEWLQSIDHYKGCSNCKKRVILDEKSLARLYPELIKEWHPTKNEHLTPYEVTCGSNKKVWWICNKCGYEWSAKISSRSIKKSSCPCCSNHVVVKGINDLASTHPNIAKEWHPTKNGNLTPYDVTYGQRKQVWWMCQQGHEYQSSINNRTNKENTQCPICYSGRQTSFAEQAFYYYLKQLYPDAINRFKADFLGKMELDIYIPSTHIAIEYDGEAWHKNEKVDRERKKYQICKEHEIYLIRLKEKDYTGEKNADECFIFPDLYRAKKLDYIIPKLLNKLDTKIVDIYNINNTWIKNYDVNIKRDRIKILSCFATQHKKDSFAEKCSEIAKEWHPTKNENLTPYMFKPHSNHKVWWKCSECGYEYEATIGHRVSGTGCIKCSTKRSAEKRGRVVYMIDPVTNKIIRKFNTISMVKKELNINPGNIAMVCKGERSKAGGYIWKYEEDLYDEK